MKTNRAMLTVLLLLLLPALLACNNDNAAAEQASPTPSPEGMPMKPVTALPAPQLPSVDLQQAIDRRRSVRDFTDNHLTTAQISALLWAAQGVTDPQGLRAAPSAGATYPLEIYLATPDGLFHYLPDGHRLEQPGQSDLRRELSAAALGQASVADAPAVFVIAAVVARTTHRYGQRGHRYVHMEMGHAAQNIHLTAVALGLGSVPIGAFDDAAVARVLNLPDDRTPGYLIPVGTPAE